MEQQVAVEVGTQVPLGGATGVNLVGTVVKLDGEGDLASAKVSCWLFDRWYPVKQIQAAIAAQS